MATLKHIASKNSDYTAIEAYLIYQHDEFTGKQLLDEHGMVSCYFFAFSSNSNMYLSKSDMNSLS